MCHRTTDGDILRPENMEAVCVIFTCIHAFQDTVVDIFEADTIGIVPCSDLSYPEVSGIQCQDTILVIEGDFRVLDCSVLRILDENPFAGIVRGIHAADNRFCHRVIAVDYPGIVHIVEQYSCRLEAGQGYICDAYAVQGIFRGVRECIVSCPGLVVHDYPVECTARSVERLPHPVEDRLALVDEQGEAVFCSEGRFRKVEIPAVAGEVRHPVALSRCGVVVEPVLGRGIQCQPEGKHFRRRAVEYERQEVEISVSKVDGSVVDPVVVGIGAQVGRTRAVRCSPVVPAKGRAADDVPTRCIGEGCIPHVSGAVNVCLDIVRIVEPVVIDRVIVCINKNEAGYRIVGNRVVRNDRTGLVLKPDAFPAVTDGVVVDEM